MLSGFFQNLLPVKSTTIVLNANPYLTGFRFSAQDYLSLFLLSLRFSFFFGFDTMVYRISYQMHQRV